jgi:hypothetical protein
MARSSNLTVWLKLGRVGKPWRMVVSLLAWISRRISRHMFLGVSGCISMRAYHVEILGE